MLFFVRTIVRLQPHIHLSSVLLTHEPRNLVLVLTDLYFHKNDRLSSISEHIRLARLNLDIILSCILDFRSGFAGKLFNLSRSTTLQQFYIWNYLQWNSVPPGQKYWQHSSEEITTQKLPTLLVTLVSASKRQTPFQCEFRCAFNKILYLRVYFSFVH